MKKINFRISNRILNQFSSPYIIAEIGINHNRSINNAFKMIDYASNAKCDAVKFQTININKLMIKNSPLANYQKTKKIKNMNELILKYNFNYNDFEKIKKYCDKKKITFLSTPFDEESADFLNKINVKAFKISSSDNDNLNLLKAIKKFNKPIILSTGMSNYSEINAIIDKLKIKKNKLCLLHCITDYPTNLAESQIGYINKLKKLGYLVGYSDHTIGETASIAALSLGAIIIEKHITLSNKMEGPDHIASLECKYLKKFVSDLKNIKKSLNVSDRYMSQTENRNKKVAKKTIYFSKKLKKNHTIKIQDLQVLRPRKNGKSPIFINDFVGKKLKEDIDIQQILEKKLFY